MDDFFRIQKSYVDSKISAYLDVNRRYQHLLAARYSILPEGKRYRAIIAMEIYRLLGGADGRYDKAIVALEFLHQSSLIFDDLPSIDNAPLRKGKPSVHLEYGESNAIFAGLFLQEEGRKLLNEAIQDHLGDVQEVMQADVLINQAIKNVLLGQELDLDIKKNDNDLISSMQLKNSMLFLAVLLPVHLLKKQNLLNVFEKIGNDLALAYQLFDDLRDLKNSTLTGKPTGVDKDKNTSVYRFGEEQVKSMLKDKLDEVYSNLDKIDGSAKVKSVLEYIFKKES